MVVSRRVESTDVEPAFRSPVWWDLFLIRRVAGRLPPPGAAVSLAAMIRFEGLSKSYGSLRALRDLSLRVGPGEVYALLGPNGAGKTTALRCLATLLEPSAGTATVDGIDVRREPLEARRRIGFLSASMGLYERLTAREMIEYFGRLQGLGRDELGSRVEALVDLFGVAPFESRYCGRLSTGQRQRVTVARAIVHDPPALILDEPTLGLDVLSGETIYQFIRGEKLRGKAILFSTHQMAEVELLADRIGVIANGRLVTEGSVQDLLDTTREPNLARAFLRLVETAPTSELQDAGDVA